MKVLIIVGRFHPNLTEWVDAFHSSGWEVEVLVGGESVNRVERVTPRIIPPEEIDRTVATALADEIRPDLVIIRSKNPGQRRIARAAKRRGAAAIYYDQRPWLRARGLRAWRWDLKKVWQRIRAGHPLTGFTTTRGHGVVPRLWRHWLRVPMPVSDNIENRHYFRDGIPTILLVGRLANQKKRHLWVLEALESAGHPYKLLVAGAGDDSHTAPAGRRSRDYYDKVRATLGDPQLRGQVQLFEDLPHERMSELYQQADIFVLPSTQELLGISIVEAMAHGCAVVTSTGAGAIGYMTHGKDGLIFDRDSFDEFRDQLQALLDSKEETRRLGQNAMHTIREKHRPEDFVRNICLISGLKPDSP